MFFVVFWMFLFKLSYPRSIASPFLERVPSVYLLGSSPVVPFKLWHLVTTGIVSPIFSQERLNLWQGLQQIPRCWAVVQPLLCSVYRPKCVDGHVTLPSQEACRLARGFCKITALGSQWPAFLGCQQDMFASGCKVGYVVGLPSKKMVRAPEEQHWMPFSDPYSPEKGWGSCSR